MGKVCPWYRVRWLDNALRRVFFNPAKTFGPYVNPGMTVLDVGCGAGFNCLGLARLVGDGGRVIAVDLQPELLGILEARARKAGLSRRIRTRRCEADDIGADEPVDFANPFWMVHETPNMEDFLRQISSGLKPDGHLFVAEPKAHVSPKEFQRMIETSKALGLGAADEPGVRFRRAVVFPKEDGSEGAGRPAAPGG